MAEEDFTCTGDWTVDARSGRRGPDDHRIRDQILHVAAGAFGRYGYHNTSMRQIAETIGFSKAYIYKFYTSKQAIADEVCAIHQHLVLDTIDQQLTLAATDVGRLRKLYLTCVDASLEHFFRDGRLYEICAACAVEGWPSRDVYYANITRRLQAILVSGRAAGEFERKTPLEDVTAAVASAMQAVVDPVLLEAKLPHAGETARGLVDLVLRSLAP